MLGLDVRRLEQHTVLLARQWWRHFASSQYNGVYWSKAKKKFHVRVSFNRHREHVGYFFNEQEAAHAYDARLRALCADGVRLRRSLNFPTPSETSFAESQKKSQGRALATVSKFKKEEESFARLHRLFLSSPQAESYDIVRVSGSSKVDALFQIRGSLAGGLALQLKSSSMNKQGYAFSRTSGYAGMLLMLFALDSDVLWALPGASVTQSKFSIRPSSSRDRAHQVEDVGSLLENCFRNQTEFPHISLADARLQCSPTHQVEEAAHVLLRTLFHCVGCQLEKSFGDLAAVDSVLLGNGSRWRVQEKASTLQRAQAYTANLSKCRGAFGRLAYSEADFDLLLVSLLDDGRLSGLFAFPADLLARLGYLGQRPCCLPLHPPWRLPKRQHTTARYAWQLDHFVDLRNWDVGTLLPAETRVILEDLLRRFKKPGHSSLAHKPPFLGFDKAENGRLNSVESPVWVAPKSYPRGLPPFFPPQKNMGAGGGGRM